MTAFIVAALVLTLIALLLIVRPFLFAGTRRSSISMDKMNTSILDEELSALVRDKAAGQLSDEAYAAARDDVHRRLLEEGAAKTMPARAPSKTWPTIVPLMILLPLLASGLYYWFGTPAAISPQIAQNTALDPQIVKMVGLLETKLKEHPDNPTGWAMLGKSYKVMGRFDDAVAAFEKIGPALNQNADWLAEFSDIVAMQAGGNPAGRPEQLAQQALKLDPNNLLALMMAGAGAASRNDFAAAKPLFERALPLLPPDSDDAKFIHQSINQARVALGEPPLAQEKTAAAPQAPANAAAPIAGEGVPAASASKRAIALAIGISPALKAEAAGRVLFVIARNPGERMPLAVVKRSADSLPATITLDDSNSMSPARLLSSATRLEIEARVSATGSAMSSAGDLYGTTNIADSNINAAALQIDKKR